MPFVDGVCLSVSRHSYPKVKHIDKIVCVGGSESDREASTKHSGMLGSSFKEVGSKHQSPEPHENRD